jgi:hypothetical protein
VSGERVRDSLRKDSSETSAGLNNAALTHLHQSFVKLSGADAADHTQAGEFSFGGDIFSINRTEKRQILCDPKEVLVEFVTLSEYPFEKLAVFEAAERFVFAERLS